MEIIQVMLSSERVRVGLGDIAVICAFRMQACVTQFLSSARFLTHFGYCLGCFEVGFQHFGRNSYASRLP